MELSPCSTGNLVIRSCSRIETSKGRHNYFWRDYKGNLPCDAVQSDGFYIAQILHHGLLPATLHHDTQVAVTESAGQKIVTGSDVKILCGNQQGSLCWEYATADNLTEKKLEDCVLGGAEDDSKLYIGKIFHEGEWKIGKVFPPTSKWKGLRVWDKCGRTYVAQDFQILRLA